MKKEYEDLIEICLDLFDKFPRSISIQGDSITITIEWVWVSKGKIEELQELLTKKGYKLVWWEMFIVREYTPLLEVEIERGDEK